MSRGCRICPAVTRMRIGHVRAGYPAVPPSGEIVEHRATLVAAG
jgi:hypothetical protein